MVNFETGSGKNNERQLSPGELEKVSRESERRIHEQLEQRSHERQDSKRNEAERARHEIERNIHERAQQPQQEVSPERYRRETTGQERKIAYREIMSETQSQLSPASRTFSKIIHNPVIEKVSETVGKTVARPNAILAGSVSAFIIVLATYLVARYFGYQLSGFETIGAFIFGWILGIGFDFLKIMITGRR